jgi:hypothetical protein
MSDQPSGLSAYELACRLGFTGSKEEWVAMLKSGR